MHEVTPKVFVIGGTRIYDDELERYFDHIGADEFSSDAGPDAQLLIEVMGRLCYRSFQPGLNPNVTKIRGGNDEYIRNIINVRHGSVLEHPMVHCIFADVSRVFTHELVRHRVGVAISQESLRYVRLTDIGSWAPTVIREDAFALEVFTNTIESLEELQGVLAEHFKLDDPDTPFTVKKEVTSAMRRIAPIGLATTIGWSANMRTLRWLIELRTHPSAEQEIRMVFADVAQRMIEMYPAVFGDFYIEDTVNGIPVYSTDNTKV